MSKRSEDGLTEKRELFCQEFIKDLRQADAAIRAGYSEASAHVTASRLMDDPTIQARIQELMDARSRRTQITADYVLNKIRDTVDRCSSEDPNEHNPTAILKGCELLGKHLKLFTDKHEHSGPDGKPIETRDRSDLTDEEIDAKVKALLEKTKGPSDAEV